MSSESSEKPPTPPPRVIRPLPKGSSRRVKFKGETKAKMQLSVEIKSKSVFLHYSTTSTLKLFQNQASAKRPASRACLQHPHPRVMQTLPMMRSQMISQCPRDPRMNSWRPVCVKASDYQGSARPVRLRSELGSYLQGLQVRALQLPQQVQFFHTLLCPRCYRVSSLQPLLRFLIIEGFATRPTESDTSSPPLAKPKKRSKCGSVAKGKARLDSKAED